MRLSNLIALLQEFHVKHGDMEVRALWEQHTTAVSKVFRASPFAEDLAEEIEEADPLQLLLIDVEGFEEDRRAYEHPDDVG